MITITWGEISEHIEKGDLNDWIAAERRADKERQLIEDLAYSNTERRVASTRLGHGTGVQQMQIVIEIPDDRFRDIQRIASVQLKGRFPTVEQIIASGTPLQEGAYNEDNN